MENKKKINKEKIIKIINNFFNSIGFPIVIGILLLLKTILFYENTITIREVIDKELVYGTAMNFYMFNMCITK